MKVSDFTAGNLRKALANEGIDLITGPFVARVQSPLPRVACGIRSMYAHHELERGYGFADFHVRIGPGGGFRRWFRPQAKFSADGRMPFTPLPVNQAFALLEWALNWQIASCAHEYLIIHASVVERSGRAAIIPAPPGSGKSTLCAALVSRGWRLLSDELALIDSGDGSVVPIPRPVNLKNESIDVIAEFAPEAVIGEVVHGTTKGTVAYMRPPINSVARAHERAQPSWIIFPHFERGSDILIAGRPKGQAFMQIAENSVNYSVLGLKGFEILSDVVDRCECLDLTYSKLEQAIAAIEGHSAERKAHSTDPRGH